jgi:hypothetical protein
MVILLPMVMVMVMVILLPMVMVHSDRRDRRASTPLVMNRRASPTITIFAVVTIPTPTAKDEPGQGSQPCHQAQGERSDRGEEREMVQRREERLERREERVQRREQRAQRRE